MTFFNSIFSSFLLIISSSTSTQAVAVKRASVSAPNGWAYAGCYTDSVNNRTLASSQYLGVPMTIELCTAACSSDGYQYAGVEYADECYCDNTIASGASVATDGRCSMACSGNSTEICGGSNGLSLFNSTTPPSKSGSSGNSGTGASSPAAGVNASAILPFVYPGCYSDNNATGRALMFQQPVRTCACPLFQRSSA